MTIARHKYRAKPTVVDGVRFASKREAAVYQQLKALKKAGDITVLRLQPRFVLQPGYVHHGRKVRPIYYDADFEVLWADGRLEIVDVKGFAKNPVYLLKKKMFHYLNPELEIKEWR